MRTKQRKNRKLTVNPFVSEDQRRACYAKNDPNWDCDEWNAKTPTRLSKRASRKLAANAARKRQVPPGRVDPSGTAPMVKAFVTKLNAKWNALKGDIYKLVVSENAFGLDGTPIANVARDQMPQIRKEHWQEFLQFVREKVGLIEGEVVDPKSLKALQSEWSQDRVDAIPMESLKWPVLTSKDGYVLDGNHRWIKALQTETSIPVTRINEDRDQALALAKSFPKAQFVENRFQFHTSSEKLEQFQSWLRGRIGARLTSKSDEGLWQSYTQEGFARGAGKAFDEVNKKHRFQPGKGDFYSGSKTQFLRDAFGRPERVEKVKLLASRSFTDLKNVTDDVGTRIGRVLVDGLVTGKHPRKVAKEMDEELDLGRNRCEMIARTELMRVHAEGTLDAMADMGVKKVGAMVEWSTAGDSRVCPECEALEGKLFDIDDARGEIPVHPRCRCTWLPYNKDWDFEMPTANSNPEGCNQYKPCGGGSEGLVGRAKERVSSTFKKFVDRYGKAGAMAMGAAMVVTFPLPGNVFAVIAVAEGLRKLTGNAAPNLDAMASDCIDLAEEVYTYLGEEMPKVDKIKLADLIASKLAVANVFCPTGPGGGVDPTCSPGGSPQGSRVEAPRLDLSRLSKEQQDFFAKGLERTKELTKIKKTRSWTEEEKKEFNDIDRQLRTLRRLSKDPEKLVEQSLEKKRELNKVSEDRRTPEQIAKDTEQHYKSYDDVVKYAEPLRLKLLEAHEKEAAKLNELVRKEREAERTLNRLHDEYHKMTFEQRVSSGATKTMTEALQAHVEAQKEMNDFRISLGKRVTLSVLSLPENERLSEGFKEAVPAVVNPGFKRGKEQRVSEKSLKQTLGQIREAEDFLKAILSKNAQSNGSRFLSKSSDGTRLTARYAVFQGKFRAYHLPLSTSEISIKVNEKVDTIIHEWGHALEHQNPWIGRASFEFLSRRVGDEKPYSLQKRFPGVGFKRGEMGRDDQFGRAFPPTHAGYIGKDYGDRATEILSMGIQKLYNDPATLARNDPDYFHFVVGVIHGKLRR